MRISDWSSDVCSSDLPPTDPTDDLAQAIARAEDEGLVDVAYASTDSPIGPLLVAVTDAGLVRLAFQREDSDAVLEQLATRIAPRVVASRRRTDDVRQIGRASCRDRVCQYV